MQTPIIFAARPSANILKGVQLTLSHMHFCVKFISMMICLEILSYYECSTVSNAFNVYQAVNFRKIKNLFVVLARFCEMYFILQVLLIPLSILIIISQQDSSGR